MEAVTVEQTWRPLHDGHSISEMVLTLELDRNLDPLILAGVADRKEAFPELPAMNVGRGFPFDMPGMLGQPWTMNSLGQPPIALVNFDRFTPAGTVAERFSVQGKSVSYSTTEYTRWAEVSAKAYGYLTIVMPLLGEANIASVNIAYTDKFIWAVNPEGNSRLSHLLREGSALVAPAVVATDGFAHSHIGFFDTVASIPSLVNVNFNMEDQQSVGRVAVILTVIRVPLALPVICHDADLSTNGILVNVAQQAHLLSKKLLHDVVNDDIASRIGLKLP